MKKIIFSIIISTFLLASLMAQYSRQSLERESQSDTTTSLPRYNFDIGLGLGCDYSGIGVKLSYLPISSFSTFVSGGFAFVDFGWNAGVCYHIFPEASKHKLSPHIKAMYGYNEIIWLFNTKKYNKLYYGFTPGIGVEYRFGENKKHRFDLDINLPFRSQEFKDDFDIIEEDPAVDIKEPLPLAFAIGYHWGF